MAELKKTYKRVSDEAIIEAYSRLGNVWKVAEEVGLCGQTVYERTVRLGIQSKKNVFTQENIERLKKDYLNYLLDGKLGDLAKELGRTKSFICRKAKELGLTDVSRSKKSIKTFKPPKTKGWWDGKEHPKGFKGRKHKESSLKIISEKSKLSQEKINKDGKRPEIIQKILVSRFNNDNYSPKRYKTTWKSGWRIVGGKNIFFRSRWEANYARYLQLLMETGVIKAWEHEPHLFVFDKSKTNLKAYLPDFRVTNNDNSVEYHEVKGWFDERSMAKIDGMKKYYPAEKLLIISNDWFLENAPTLKNTIKEWEC